VNEQAISANPVSPAHALPPSWLVARSLLTGNMRQLIVFWIYLVVIFAAIGTGIGIFGHLDHSIWENAFDSTAMYLPVIIGLVLTTVQLPIFVAHGVTRQNFFIGAMWSVIGFSLISSLALAIGYEVEHLLYSAYGLSDALTAPHLFSTTGQFPVIFGESVLSMLAYLCTGWLIGTGFRRFGAGGLLFLVPAVVPVVGTEVLCRAGWLGAAANAIGIARPPLAIGLPVSILIILIGFAAVFVLIRALPAHGNPNANPYQPWRRN
jgi:hypothetical protein